jgi:hypothetical protein
LVERYILHELFACLTLRRIHKIENELSYPFSQGVIFPSFGGVGFKESLDAFRTMDQTARQAIGRLGKALTSRRMSIGIFIMALSSDGMFVINRKTAAEPKGVFGSAHGA